MSATHSMGAKTSPLSSAQVCAILEASAKAGVVELKFNGLHVQFGRPAEEVVGVKLPYPFVQQIPAHASVKILTEEQHNQQTKDALEADEISTREEQLARALVEDPVRYEELLRDGELSDDVDDANDGEDE